MGTIGYVGAFFQVVLYSALPYKLKKRITEKKLRSLVAYAKTHSPFFAELYKDVGDDFSLEDLPTLNKQLMYDNFDMWHTDSGISLKEVTAFIEDPANLGKPYHGKYTILMTSGSTGVPAIILQDKSSQNITGVLGGLRCIKLRFPLVTVCDDTGYGIDNESIRHNKGKASILNRLLDVVDSKQPSSEITKRLNAIRPKIIVGYTSVISLIADEAISGDLRIKPYAVFTSGEHMSESTRAKIQKAFPRARIHSIYGCTEGGPMAFECKCDHLHINCDWTILEPVDSDGNPVPYGSECDKILLTNLFNRIQPLIRYELTDEAVIHDDPCPCGKKGLWLEVGGRSNSNLKFIENGETVEVSPMVLYEIIDTINYCGVRFFHKYQLILKRDNRLELRLDCFEGQNPQEVFELIKKDVLTCLGYNGVHNVEMYLSDEKPQVSARSGKLISIYQEDHELL